MALAPFMQAVTRRIDQLDLSLVTTVREARQIRQELRALTATVAQERTNQAGREVPPGDDVLGYPEILVVKIGTELVPEQPGVFNATRRTPTGFGTFEDDTDDTATIKVSDINGGELIVGDDVWVMFHGMNSVPADGDEGAEPLYHVVGLAAPSAATITTGIFVLVSLGNDFLSCHQWVEGVDDDADTLDTGTLVAVMKPPRLQERTWLQADGVTPNVIDGVTLVFTGAQTADASGLNSGGTQVSEKWNITQEYIAGDTIMAEKVAIDTFVDDGTGTRIVWRDLNTDGRGWGKV